MVDVFATVLYPSPIRPLMDRLFPHANTSTSCLYLMRYSIRTPHERLSNATRPRHALIAETVVHVLLRGSRLLHLEATTFVLSLIQFARRVSTVTLRLAALSYYTQRPHSRPWSTIEQSRIVQCCSIRNRTEQCIVETCVRVFLPPIHQCCLSLSMEEAAACSFFPFYSTIFRCGAQGASQRPHTVASIL